MKSNLILVKKKLFHGLVMTVIHLSTVQYRLTGSLSGNTSLSGGAGLQGAGGGD